MNYRELTELLEAKNPKIVARLVGQLKRKGMGVGQANAVARKTLQKSGVLKSGTTELTDKGRTRTKMGAAGRAKDREAKVQGKSTKKFVYSRKTNRATLKKK